jgi:hypothetical protein
MFCNEKLKNTALRNQERYSLAISSGLSPLILNDSSVRVVTRLDNRVKWSLILGWGSCCFILHNV